MRTNQRTILDVLRLIVKYFSNIHVQEQDVDPAQEAAGDSAGWRSSDDLQNFWKVWSSQTFTMLPRWPSQSRHLVQKSSAGVSTCTNEEETGTVTVSPNTENHTGPSTLPADWTALDASQQVGHPSNEQLRFGRCRSHDCGSRCSFLWESCFARRTTRTN